MYQQYVVHFMQLWARELFDLKELETVAKKGISLPTEKSL